MNIEDVLRLVVNFSRKHLQGESRKYLEDARGLSSNTIDYFEMGYFPFAKEAKFDLCDTKWLCYHKLGFVNNRQQFCSLFEGRITFPIYNNRGKLVAIQSRMFHEDVQLYRFNSRKYWHNSFDKSNVLYGLNYCISDVRDSGIVIVGEGQFDAITARQAGINNVVCASGTAVNLQHLSLLARYASTIFVVFDNDKGGTKGRERIAKYNLAGTRICSVVLPTEGDKKQDIDSYIKDHGAEAFKSLFVANEDSDSLVASLGLL